MQAVSYIDESKVMKSYPFKAIEQFGCSKELTKRLSCAKSMAEKLLAKTEAEEKHYNNPKSSLPTPMVTGPVVAVQNK